MTDPEAILSPPVAALLPLAWGAAGVVLARLLAPADQPPPRPRWAERLDRVVLEASAPSRDSEAEPTLWTYPGGWPEPRLASLRGPDRPLKPPAAGAPPRPAAS